MQKKMSTLILILLSAFGLAACQKSIFDTPPGHYENTSMNTNFKGMTTERSNVVDVTVDDQGKKKVVVKNKTTKDPEGFFNKSTTSESTKTIQEK
jgi:hypothetical protein